MMALIAGGRALGLKPGQHVHAQGQHPAKVITSAMSALGAGTTLGDVSGRIDALFA